MFYGHLKPTTMYKQTFQSVNLKMYNFNCKPFLNIQYYEYEIPLTNRKVTRTHNVVESAGAEATNCLVLSQGIVVAQ